MKRFVLFVVYAGLVLLLAFFILTWVYGYESLMNILINAIGQADKSEQILALITPSKYKIIQIVLVVFSLVTALLIYFFDRVWSILVSCFSYLKSCFKFLLRQLSDTSVKWILIVPFLSAVYFAFTMPVSYDEAYTYLQFTTRSPLASLCYYPVPNNHVLHSLITNFTRYVPFFSELFCLRISSVIFSLITWLMCFSFLKKYYSLKFSLVVTAIASMLFMSVYYSYMSRGYGLIVLFFIISLYATFNIIYGNNVRRNWIVFSLSCILGFFTVPSYLYAWIILNAIILLNVKNQIKNQFIYNCIILFVVVLLYTPIILVNGIGALVGNKFVMPIGRAEVLNRLLEYFSNTLFEITGIHALIILILLIISVYFILKNRSLFEKKITFLFLILPAFVLIAHSVIPFARTFNYYGFVLIFLIFLPYEKWISEFSIRYLIVGCVLIQSVLFINFFLSINTYEGFNVLNHELNKKIMGNKRYYFDTALFEVDFLFENQTHGFVLEKATYNFPPQKIDTDTLSGFDYYIIEKQFDCTKVGKPTYSNSITNIYTE